MIMDKTHYLKFPFSCWVIVVEITLVLNVNLFPFSHKQKYDKKIQVVWLMTLLT